MKREKIITDIFLTEPTPEMEKSFYDYIDEWERAGEPVVPYASARNGKEYGTLMMKWTLGKQLRGPGDLEVPSTMYFLMNDKGKILGMLHCRWELNDYFLNFRGHIAYGVRPSERGKGYAPLMLGLALEMYRQRGINKVLLTCDKKNAVSAGIIISRGGVFESETFDEKRTTRRYWIDLR